MATQPDHPAATADAPRSDTCPERVGPRALTLVRKLGPGLVAALPGLVLTGLALSGLVPTVRDLPSYFAPLRAYTAAVLRGAHGPFWTPLVGCGEPYYANPQSGLLYPPVWSALLVDPARAVGVEAGLHLALLGVGCMLLARRLGARPGMALAAAWGAVLAGPTSDAVGVLNNLETLAWAPLVWVAALGGAVPATAALLALAYLAAEPQLAVVIGVIALALAPRRRTVAALALAVGLVAVQALPFAAWVRGGDRGPGRELEAVCAGALLGEDLLGTVAPGALVSDRPDRFVALPAVPLWLVVLGACAVAARDRRVRTLAIAGWLLIALAALPGASWGCQSWAWLTAGLVRYPGRLLFPAVIALAPAGAAAWQPGRRQLAAAAAGAGLALVATLAGAGSLPLLALQAATALGCAAAPLAPWAALAGAAGVLPLDVGNLKLARTAGSAPPPCLDVQRAAHGRVWAVQPSWDQIAWLRRDPQRGYETLAMGYLALADGRHTARTFAPLRSRHLVAHLEAADRGPSGRWWLDTLAADVLLSHRELPGFPVGCRWGSLVACHNPAAWPLAVVLRDLPRPGEAPVVAGAVLAENRADDRVRWRVRVEGGPGVLVRSSTPDPGWSFTVDGAAVAARQGPGILHGPEVPRGEHEVVATYRPPGLRLGAALSAIALAVLAWLARCATRGR